MFLGLLLFFKEWCKGISAWKDERHQHLYPSIARKLKDGVTYR